MTAEQPQRKEPRSRNLGRLAIGVLAVILALLMYCARTG
jgi:hypothetical protein